MALTVQAEKKLLQLFVATAKKYGIQQQPPQVGQHYAATPSVAQTIYEKLVEDGAPFLSRINIIPVTEMKGEKVGLSLSGRVASRTDTNVPGNERTPKHLVQEDALGYELFPTEFDVALKYAKIDSWAKFDDFAARYMSMVRKAIGNDMLQVGWTGTHAAIETDIATYPLLQDLNKGWLQILRDFNSGSQHVLGGAKGVAGAVTLGETDPAIGGFKTLDSLAKSAKEMLPIYHRERDDLVLLAGSNVLSYQQDVFYDTHGNTPSEKRELNAAITKSYAELPTIVPPFFPADSIMVTPLDNLSIYYQDSSMRRTQKDKPEMNEVQDFNSVNQGYVVEDEEAAAFIEGITYK